MLSDLSRSIRPAAVLFLAMTFITGVAYPLVVSGVAWMLFPSEAGGSLITRDGRVIGSRLIGQPFDGERYFWSRPSATTPYPYNAGGSSGSNLGPTNPALIEVVKERASRLKAVDLAQSTIPIDLVTASASGLDPHISPAAAYYQVERVAMSRGLSKDDVEKLVEQHIEARTLGVLGEPRVNVLLLNLALDEMR
jgi:potassium-transporting ATPase KdpC subunit